MTSRRLILPALIGLSAALLFGFAATQDWLFTDYDTEAAPAFDALRAGDFSGFVDLTPLYAGSLVIRAPFVLISEALGGGALAAFRAATLPCVLASVALGVVLFGQIKGPGRWLALALAVCNPIAFTALEFGHSEELLGGVLCVAAVICALQGKPIWAAVLLGLALGNKAWAVLAIGPVLVALDRDRVKVAAIAVGLGVLVSFPLLVSSHETATAATTQAATAIFKPSQVWWFFGSPGDFGGPKQGFRVAPEWVLAVARPLIMLVWIPLTVCFVRLRRPRHDALGLLALLLALRCVLDFWNTTYYALPLLLALLAWEATRGRTPLVTLAVTAGVWLNLEIAPNHLSPDAQTAIYLAWWVPMTGLLAWRVFSGEGLRDARAALLRRTHGFAPALARRPGAAG